VLTCLNYLVAKIIEFLNFQSPLVCWLYSCFCHDYMKHGVMSSNSYVEAGAYSHCSRSQLFLATWWTDVVIVCAVNCFHQMQTTEYQWWGMPLLCLLDLGIP
jgi:hypothetical protein